MAGFVVEHDAFAHGRRGYRLNIFGSHAGAAQCAADDFVNNSSVPCGVEIECSGDCGVLLVRPFPLRDSDLVAVDIEDETAATASTGVDGHDIGQNHVSLQRLFEIRFQS